MVAACALLAAALLAPASAAAFEPISSFGSDGEGAGQLSAPGGIAVGPNGDFYVADQGNDRVDVFSSAGEFRFAFGAGVRPGGGVCDAGSGCQRGEGGGAAGALDRPAGIAISASGEVYVAEEGNDRVSVFSATGAFVLAFGYHVAPPAGDVCTAESGCQAGSNLRVPAEPAEGEFQHGPEGAVSEPSGVAIDPAGDVFVADTGNDRISVFDPLGKFLYMFGIEVEGVPGFGNFCETQCIEGFAYDGAEGMDAPAGVAITPEGQLAISDSGNHRIDVFGLKGEFVRAIGREVDPAAGDVCTLLTGCTEGEVEGAGALSEPVGLALGPSGSFTIADFGLERVSQFDADGEFVRAFGAGVTDGAEAFEVCTALTGCLPGLQSAVAGATPEPFGVAEACAGSIFVTESTTGLSRVERFGEAGSGAVCAAPARPAPPGMVAVRTVPTNLFQLGRLRRDRRRGTATLLVSVPGAGELDLGGRGIHTVARGLTSAAAVQIPVRFVGRFHRDLLAAGHRKALASITFTPDGGSARTETRQLTLVKRAKPRPRRHR